MSFIVSLKEKIMFKKFLLLTFLFFSFPSFASAPPAASSARLFSPVEGVGQIDSVPVGIEITLKEGWKTYWRTPGEAGLAPVFDFKNSTNVKETKIFWPAPHRFVAFGIENFGYKNRVVFPLDIVPEKRGEGVSLDLKLDILVCEEICVPESHRLTLGIPVGANGVSKDHPLYEEAITTIPEKDGNESFHFDDRVSLEEKDGKKYLVASAAMNAAPSDEADLFVEHSSYPTLEKPTIEYDETSTRATFRAAFKTDEPLSKLQEDLSKGAMTLTYADDKMEGLKKSFETSLSLDPPPIQTATPDATEAIGLSILLVAFLGGLILNLMPCVLPVLSLKILSVVSHGGKDHRIHRAEIFKNFMASAAGILFSFWIMAAALAALKSAGETIGWGIQFQHPGFLIFLIVILLFFAVNLWGLFEIPLPRFIARNISQKHEHQPTLIGHFMTGAFATLLATPCTAPFLGTAVGFALARDASTIFTIFTFLGLGLAFPYMLLAVMPRIFKYMPRPGAWMIHFKKVLSVALALTAVWLIHVLVTLTTAPVLDAGWTKFDEKLIKEALDDGKTVIVDITADWCLTCKANKKFVLEQKDVVAALSAPNIVKLQADWTQRDEVIATYLRKHGRYGIPFNIVYGPAKSEGIVLSELLTKKEVMDALSEVTGE